MGAHGITLFEWVGTATGIAGALLMASGGRRCGWAYPIWLISSISFTIFGALGSYYGLVLTQALFTAINIYGCYRWVYVKHSEGEPLTRFYMKRAGPGFYMDPKRLEKSTRVDDVARWGSDKLKARGFAEDEQ